MTLKQWRERNGISQEAAARLFGVRNATVVSKWEIGRQLPRKQYMRAIYLKTGGMVTPNDFYDLPELAIAA